MTRIASGSENDGYDLESRRLHLSIPLMWKVLQFNSKPKLIGMPTSGLLHHSLAPAVSTEEVDDNSASTLDVIVAISPDVTVNIADGGTATHMPQSIPRTSSASATPNMGFGDKIIAPAESLMSNAPWLWDYPLQFVGIQNKDYPDSEATIGNVGGVSTWWDLGDL